jgi:hypothetical protein
VNARRAVEIAALRPFLNDEIRARWKADAHAEHRLGEDTALAALCCARPRADG